MSYCFNPACLRPQNSSQVSLCLSCGAELLLKQRYRALKLLDVGGMSRAFLASDENTPSHQICVVKQFFPAQGLVENSKNSKNYNKLLELFQREALQLDRLGKESPRIPRLFAYLEQDKGFYLVQEYIDGQNLLRNLDNYGVYGEMHIRQLLQEILPILQYVHDSNVIHRDIKPENIMRRQNGQIVLIDFGISKQLTDQVVSGGTTGGTIGYAAPEQVLGGAAYPASDLYSLGATCIHLLTKIPPDRLYDFQQDRWLWKDILAKEHRYISNNLTEILDKMLQVEVKKRYQSARAILADLANSYTISEQVVRAKRRKKIAIAMPIFIAGIVSLISLDHIKCHIGIETSLCPISKGPRLVNGVMYFPFEPGEDKNGKSAEFNIAILSQEYIWQPGSSIAVMSTGNSQKIPIGDLKVVMEAKGITKIMENPNQIVAVGTSSCEGEQVAEEIRSFERAKTIQNTLAKPIFSVKNYYMLSLGQFSRDNCSRTAKDNAFQRKMILMGIRKESNGVILSEALRHRLTRVIKDFNLDDYSLGGETKFQLLPSDTHIDNPFSTAANRTLN